MWLWRLFSSIKLALALILLIAGMSLIGTLTSLSIFDSIWFAIPGCLLMLNILICSLNRWKGIKLSVLGGPVQQKESFYNAGDNYIELPPIRISNSEVEKKIELLLKSRGYRVRSKTEDNNMYITADKNRYFRLGTYLSHFSLILFVFAFIGGSHFGFRIANLEVPVGSTAKVGQNSGLSLQLISFSDQYYNNGMPKDYRSQVVLYHNGQEVRQATIRVNHPLTYGGIRFYQAFFGPAAELQIQRNGSVIFDGEVPLDNTSVSGEAVRYLGVLDLQNGLKVRLISSAENIDDTMIPAGQLGLEVLQDGNQIGLTLMQKVTPQTIGNLEFTYNGESQFSGFQVSKDPTNTLIWVASILFIIGISAVLYFPYRHIWVLIQSGKQKTCSVTIRSLPSRSFGNTTEMSVFVTQIKHELQIPEDKN